MNTLIYGATALLALACGAARADVVVDWNIAAGNIVNAADIPTPVANRVFAIAHTASYEAADAITHRYTARLTNFDAPRGASVDAAIAAAHRATLLELLPQQQAAIESAYAAALAKIPRDDAQRAGIDAGERAAREILAMRADDGAAAPESYRPRGDPGVYVPTSLPLVTEWPNRKPWLLSSPAQFRPGPPPELNGEIWARDYNESQKMGSKTSTVRTAEQTAIARFWETHRPTIYHGILRSVALAPGRDVMRNARLFAAASQACDDALIAVFDGKYAYAFWRPITAIRNGDRDGNDATQRDPAWRPLIDTPMHPEYPCAHCIVAAALGRVIEREAGAGLPVLTTTSPTAGGAARSWTSVDAFVREVGDARVWDGVHYRNSTEVAADMGRKIGDLAVARFGLGE